MYIAKEQDVNNAILLSRMIELYNFIARGLF